MSPILERQIRLHFAQTWRPVVATMVDSAFCFILRSLRLVVLFYSNVLTPSHAPSALLSSLFPGVRTNPTFLEIVFKRIFVSEPWSSYRSLPLLKLAVLKIYYHSHFNIFCSFLRFAETLTELKFAWKLDEW